MTKKEKKSQKEEDLKKIYRIWYDYLMQSRGYKLLCDWMRESKLNPNLPPPKIFQYKRKTRVHPVWGVKRKGPGWKYERQMAKKEIHPMAWGFAHWGDIHAQPFEEWWALKKGYFLPSQGVREFGEAELAEIGQIIEQLIRAGGGKLNIQEFNEYFLSWLKSPGRILIAVDFWSDENNETMTEEFYRLLTRRKRDQKVMEFSRWRAAWRYPTGYPIARKRLDEIERYLKIYICHEIEGLKWQKIAQIIYPNLNFQKNLSRTLRRYLKKAEKIIENVEKGEFPGKYQ